MRFRILLQLIIRVLVENHFVLSLGVSAASGMVLASIHPLNLADPFLRLIEPPNQEDSLHRRLPRCRQARWYSSTRRAVWCGG